MLLILDGEVEIDLAPGADRNLRHVIGKRSMLGEIGFLSGKGATADAKATTPLRALAINREVLTSLEQNAPEIAAEFSRQLARTAMTRLQSDGHILKDLPSTVAQSLEVVMCSRPQQVREAQRLRYDVICGEFGRPSPYARHDDRLIIDNLDQRGTSFLMQREGNAIATARVNFARDGHLGMLPKIYGLTNSKSDLEQCALITKQAVIGDYRSGGVYVRLFGAMMTFIAQTDIREVYIDCVPEIAHIYNGIGFEQCAEEFVDYDTGLSVPMKLDAVAYQSRMPIEERHRTGTWNW